MDNATIYNSHWAITPEALQNIASYDVEKLEDPVPEPQEGMSYKEGLSSFMKQFDECIQLTEEGVGVIDVKGPLMPHPGAVERVYFGAVDSVQLADLIRNAADMEEVKSLVLNIESPGGTVVGTAEVGAALRAFNQTGKESFAFTDSMMASAAYWIGSQATQVVATESALVGSVGVIRPHADMTGMYDKAGLKIEIFRAGKFKVPGAMGTSLTDEQREDIQAGVDEVHKEFKETVNMKRKVPDKYMEGKVYYGKDALDKDFLDKVVEGLFSVIGKATASAIHHDGVDNLNTVMSEEPNNNIEEAEEVNAVEEIPVVAVEKAANEKVAETVDKEEADLPKENESSEEDSAEEGNEEPTEELASEEPNEEAVEELNAEDLETITLEEDPLSVIDELKASLEEANASLASFKEEFNNKLEELSSERAEVLAQEKAAKIAAECGVEAADVTGEDKAIEKESKYAHMNAAELWEACAKINGENEKRKFYLDHIQPRQR